MGHDITQEELDTIMKEHDIANDDVISFMEFKALLFDIHDIKDAEELKLDDL